MDRPGETAAALATPPAASARQAGLRYASDVEPGLRRLRARGGFRYVDAAGRPVRDPATLERIRKLAIPPAWTDVWICVDRDGHIQATGRDARRRKQYRYHPAWQEVRDQTKYDRILAFARALPALRERLKADLALPGLPRDKVLAAVVSIMERTFIRVGNEEYARDNGSFGAASLRDEHVDVQGATMTFRFRGKSGKMHDITHRERRLAKIVKACQDLPGQELFQYVDEDGTVRDVTSSDVNNYLRSIMGEAFTAKDFRTWAGTVLAAMALRDVDAQGGKGALRRGHKQAIALVADRLGNTAAVCRRCYVHPAVIEGHVSGLLQDFLAGQAPPAIPGLEAHEAAVLAFLEQRLTPAEALRASVERAPRADAARGHRGSFPR